MISRMLVAGLSTFVLFIPEPTMVRTTGADVTFTMPVNLTQLSPDIGKVEVNCNIFSSAIPIHAGTLGGLQGVPGYSGHQDIVVSGGKAVATATVVVPIPSLINAVGQTATYSCTLKGFSTSLQQWGAFDASTHANAWHLTPPPADLTGSFVW